MLLYLANALPMGCSWPLFTFKAKVGDKVHAHVMTHNRTLDWCDRDLDKGDSTDSSRSWDTARRHQPREAGKC